MCFSEAGAAEVVVIFTYEPIPHGRQRYCESMPQAVRVDESKEGGKVEHFEERCHVHTQHKDQQHSPARAHIYECRFLFAI
jgi:hypothetical protein